MAKRNPKYVFVAGGVMSGVGKGVTSSSIANILQAHGLEITALKIDPYVNVDAGTMNPTEHGEVFVLDDGTECDQDMGNYERFLDRSFSKIDYMTTGSVYLSVIQKERNLGYKGKQVEVVPRIPLEVIERIDVSIKKHKADVAVVEIGGTVGEYENILFLEAVRMLKIKHPEDVAVVLVSFLPALGSGGTELKTKPTQHAVRSLNAVGVHPDMIFGRASAPLDKKRKEKIEFMCSIKKGNVISAPNVESIYEVPMNFEKEKVGARLLECLGLKSKGRKSARWEKFVADIKRIKKEATIGVVGKYFGTGDFILEDAYISVLESIKHAAYAEKRKPKIEWIDAEDFEPKRKNYKESLKKLNKLDGVVVPGGFGSRGIEGKIQAIQFCREKKIPYLGLCYGMQLMVIEFARNVAKIKDAHTAEIDAKGKNLVIDILPEQKELLKKKDYGGTMRLGAYPTKLRPGTIARKAYGKPSISERHRHRYEVNPEYIEHIEKAGLIFSGHSPDRRLMEIAELPKKKHPFMLGTQFHPEFKSRPLKPHPIFHEFIKAATKQKK